MAKKLFVLLMMMLIVVTAVMAAGDCPSSNKVLNCTPKCLHDSECSAKGGKCCSNICNGRSCADSNVLGSSGAGGSPFSSKDSSSSGSYCGNVKCSNFEKCESDRSTKRPKCVRS